jgi:hypothetical protein
VGWFYRNRSQLESLSRYSDHDRKALALPPRAGKAKGKKIFCARNGGKSKSGRQFKRRSKENLAAANAARNLDLSRIFANKCLNFKALIYRCSLNGFIMVLVILSLMGQARITSADNAEFNRRVTATAQNSCGDYTKRFRLRAQAFGRIGDVQETSAGDDV